MVDRRPCKQRAPMLRSSRGGEEIWSWGKTIRELLFAKPLSSRAAPFSAEAQVEVLPLPRLARSERQGQPFCVPADRQRGRRTGPNALRRLAEGQCEIVTTTCAGEVCHSALALAELTVIALRPGIIAQIDLHGRGEDQRGRAMAA